MTQNGQLLNFINGQWTKSSTASFMDILNPATAQPLTHVPLSPGAEVAAAVAAGQKRRQCRSRPDNSLSL